MRDYFETQDPKNAGRPIYWCLENHIKAVEQLIRADEVQLALQLLNMVPGWWRDNYPKELTEIKQTLYRQTYDQIEYASDDEEAECPREMGESQWTSDYCYPRADILNKIVKDLNSQLLQPWIFDLGCSHGNMPLGLIKNGSLFKYKGVGLNGRIVSKVKDWVDGYWAEKPTKGQPTILYCTEVIEHCFNPHDIVHSAHKLGIEFDHIILSVPLYCLGGGLENWDTRRIGHVRNWTPKELIEFADKGWPGYTWTFYGSSSMVIVGVKA